jgi:hypothetical protein
MVLVTGCQSFVQPIYIKKVPKDPNTILKEHVVMFDEDGHPVDPTGNYECQPKPNPEDPAYCEGKHSVMVNYPRLQRKDFKKHVLNIIESARADAEGKKVHKIQLLFFVHGGLNTQLGSLERIVGEGPDSTRMKHTRYNMIMEKTPYYPIFINWQSSLVASYFDHLLYVRQGERWPWYTGWLTAPVVLAVDIGRSILRADLPPLFSP